MSRSKIHMLHVFAERLEDDHAPKEAVNALRLFANDRTIRRAEHRDRDLEETKRIERQRSLFNLLPSCSAADRLKEAMLQRAYDLLWDGDALGCDALIEFLPSSEVEAMLNAWSDDWDDDEKLSKPRSRWYKGEAA